MQTDFITVKQAALLLDRHPVYVARLLRESRLPGFKCGQWRISRSALLAFIAAGSNQTSKVEAA